MALDLNILIGGAAGQGVHAITGPLVKALVRRGCQVQVTQSYQSRIRGGHLFNLIRIGDRPLLCPREGVDLLVALNQETIELHHPEVSPEGIIIFDAAQAGRPGGNVKALALSPDILLPDTQAGDIAVNAGAAGAILGFLDVPVDGLVALLEETFAAKGEEVAAWNRQAAQRGYTLGRQTAPAFSLAGLAQPAEPLLVISGHEALALGALAGGLTFICGYPMTPWTSLFNAVSQRAARWQVVVEQTEDEIAAINMAIGASFAGARAMTGTSGGGFCLMTEGVGLAAMTETPVVVVVAQRPGPSTGLPTRTSQGDLEFVLHAGQDNFPRMVLAPGTPAQGYRLGAQALHLAERYQTPVFILTDQYFGDSQLTCTAADFPAVPAPPEIDRGPGGETYQRYALTADGISPRRLPGFGPEIVVADSDEHTPDGHLSEDLTMRVKMHDKRLRKLRGMAEEMDGVTRTGDPDAPLALLTWGSSLGAAAEAAARLKKACMVHLSELWPFPHDAVARALSGVKKLVCVEGNAVGQLGRLLRRETGRAPDHLILRYDGLPFTPEYILRHLPGEVG
ncbi:MAG: 2-oxoacid:acceptor oxidoreductase subunit alpha [Desulfobaccales bacterium]